MANNCINYLNITGHPFLIKEFMNAYTNEGHFDFAKISPMPSSEELIDIGTDSYNWSIENWGQKWYIDQADYEDYGDDFYSVIFDTAWNPCIPIILKLIELCPGLEFEYDYYESGMGFLGWIRTSDGDVEDVEINVNEEPFAYWYHIFNKEYESYDWLYDIIDERHDINEITNEQYQELCSLLNSDNLEELVEKSIEYNILT